VELAAFSDPLLRADPCTLKQSSPKPRDFS
jgi:hypothetical protein